MQFKTSGGNTCQGTGGFISGTIESEGGNCYDKQWYQYGWIHVHPVDGGGFFGGCARFSHGTQPEREDSGKVRHADPENVYVLTELVGDELEIIDPYGGTLQAYGLCYETMRKTILKLVNLLNESEDNGTD